MGAYTIVAGVINMQDRKNKTSDAQLKANARYIAEKTDEIRARLPRGYGDKLNKIAEKAGTSKAQVLKKCIDMLYSEMFGDV